jgi:hypothetical protein
MDGHLQHKMPLKVILTGKQLILLILLNLLQPISQPMLMLIPRQLRQHMLTNKEPQLPMTQLLGVETRQIRQPSFLRVRLPVISEVLRPPILIQEVVDDVKPSRREAGAPVGQDICDLLDDRVEEGHQVQVLDVPVLARVAVDCEAAGGDRAGLQAREGLDVLLVDGLEVGVVHALFVLVLDAEYLEDVVTDRTA